MQKRRNGIVRLRAARVGSTGLHPAVGVEGAGIWAPEMGGRVDGPRADYDGCTRGDEVVLDGGVVGGFAEGEGDGGVDAHCFL